MSSPSTMRPKGKAEFKFEDRNSSSTIPSNAMIKIVVGTPGPSLDTFQPTQRAFLIPKALFAYHSSDFSKMLAASSEAATRDEVLLPGVDPKMFQNFVDYMHSQIYSLDTRGPEFDPTMAHCQAWVLGTKVGCAPFREAALLKLWDLLRRCAKSKGVNRAESPIKPAHLQYACENDAGGSGLRMLLVHGVCAHWTNAERAALNKSSAMFAGTPTPADGEAGVTCKKWITLHNNVEDFRREIRLHLLVTDDRRHTLLEAAKTYLSLDSQSDPWKQGATENATRAKMCSALNHKKMRKSGAGRKDKDGDTQMMDVGPEIRFVQDWIEKIEDAIESGESSEEKFRDELWWTASREYPVIARTPAAGTGDSASGGAENGALGSESIFTHVKVEDEEEL